jgi:PepSY-associated TM region
VKFLVFLHRWLGVCGCLLFLVWFVSGIVMMYVEMPELSEQQRLAALPVLDAPRAQVSAQQAIERAHLLGVASIKLTSLFGRPAWQLRGIEDAWCTVFADTGEVARSFDYENARASLAHFLTAGAHPRLIGTVDEPDQWTVSGDYDDLFPLYHVALNDPVGTELYLSGATGEVVLRSTSRARALAWIGAIPHWIYFTRIRKHAENWRLLVIWLAGTACAAAILGLIAGVWRWSTARRTWSPYRGSMRWHHGAGLLFGTLTLTWAFSGLLSLEPGHYSTGSAPTLLQQAAFSGEPDYSIFTEPPKQVLRAHPSAKELQPDQVDGRPYYLVIERDSPPLLVAIDGRPVHPFPRSFLLAAAQRAVPQGHIVEQTLLNRYDAYYYDRESRRPLPALRVKFDDPARSWLYIDPQRASIVARYERSGRIDRWLYQGLHHLDFPFLWPFRPLWDIVVIILLAGGILLSSTGVLIGYRRLALTLGRFARRAPLKIRS